MMMHCFLLSAAVSRHGDRNPMMFLFIVGGIVALVIVAGLFTHWYEKKRTRQLAIVAEELGFAFSPSDSNEQLLPLERFHLFSQGRSKHIWNLMSGQAEDVEIMIFDYRYTIGSGKHKTTLRQSVVVLRRTEWNLPEFHLRPESVFTKIGQVFGYRDCNFPDYPVFNKRYILRGSNEAAIRSAFNGDVLTFYESQSGLSTEAAGDCAIVYRAQKREAPEQIPALFDAGWAVSQLFKPAPVSKRVETLQTMDEQAET